jgi:hypothetical protein
VIGSTDQQIRALLSLSIQDGKALAKRHDWQRLQKEKTFTATATETQSAMIPSDLDRFIPGTFWNRSQDRRVVGPISPQQWQQLKTGLLIMPWDSFRVRGDALLMNPTPIAGDAMAFEYVTTYWAASASDTTPDQATWVADDDISFLDDEVQTLGVVWRFKKARGLEYAEEFQEYEVRLAQLMGVDGGQSTMNMGIDDGGSNLSLPYVTDGNWSIS